MAVSEVQEPIQVHKRGPVGKLMEKEVEYRQINQKVWQIRRSYQGSWKDFANELTPEERVRRMIKGEYDVRY